MVKHTFHRLVKVALLLRLLSANCQSGCPPPIYLSSLPWLVVVLPLVTPYPPPPVVFMTRRLILSSSYHATSTSPCFKVPQAFKTPLPLVCWCLRIVTMPLVAPLPLLVLSTIHCHLSANTSPPVGLLFARWLSCHPCCCATAASCPHDTPPSPLILSTRHIRLKTSRLHLAISHRLLSAGASPLVCLSFAGWFSHIILSHHCLKCPSSTPTFIHTSWLLRLISSGCFRLPFSHQHCCLLMRWQLPSHLPLVCLVACVFDLVCPISWFMAMSGICPNIYNRGGELYPICPYAKKPKKG